MMLQSWDGAIRVFPPPAWPSDMDGEFTTFRTEGAFLVGAACKDGAVGAVTIHNEAGLRCRIASPWTGPAVVTDAAGQTVQTTIEADNIICFDTRPGQTYTLTPAD